VVGREPISKVDRFESGWAPPDRQTASGRRLAAAMLANSFMSLPQLLSWATARPRGHSSYAMFRDIMGMVSRCRRPRFAVDDLVSQSTTSFRNVSLIVSGVMVAAFRGRAELDQGKRRKRAVRTVFPADGDGRDRFGVRLRPLSVPQSPAKAECEPARTGLAGKRDDACEPPSYRTSAAREPFFGIKYFFG
jgi:hypothetical protein